MYVVYINQYLYRQYGLETPPSSVLQYLLHVLTLHVPTCMYMHLTHPWSEYVVPDRYLDIQAEHHLGISLTAWRLVTDHIKACPYQLEHSRNTHF